MTGRHGSSPPCTLGLRSSPPSPAVSSCAARWRRPCRRSRTRCDPRAGMRSASRASSCRPSASLASCAMSIASASSMSGGGTRTSTRVRRRVCSPPTSQVSAAEWKNTVVVALSEFGRTFRKNGNRGTDHGHGTVYWVLGGSVNGGRIAGAQRALARGTLFQDRDYPVLNDYRAVLGGLFRSLWTLTPAQCTQIFPQVIPVDLHLV